MVAAPLSTVCYSKYGPYSIVYLLAITPIPMIPLLYVFYEDFNVKIQSTYLQLQEIWNTVCSRSVWQPMGFIYLYNLLQVQNIAWKQYLQDVHHFNSEQLNSLLVISYIFLFMLHVLSVIFLFIISSCIFHILLNFFHLNKHFI